MFTIVICTMDNVSYLKQTFGIIINYKNLEQIIIIDNSLRTETQTYLNTLQDIRITSIRNNKNKGVIRSRNQGLALSSSEYTLVLDDDQIPALETLNAYTKALKRFSIVGCEAQIMDLMTGLTKLGTKDKFSYVGAGGMCMKTKLWKELGLFDEIYQPAYFEDPDLVLKAKAKGYTVGLVENHKIYHHGHKTLFRKDLGFDGSKVMLRNRKIFLARHGAKDSTKNVKLRDLARPIKILHVLSNLNIGGVQQNALYIATGLADKGFEMVLYVAESKKQGMLEQQAGSKVKVLYNKVISKNPAKIYKNIGHRVQVVLDKFGQSKKVKPGGLLADNGYNLRAIKSFRLDHEIPTEVNLSIVDAVIKYRPDIVHYHRDVSRISRDVAKLRKMPQFKRLKVVRTIHGSRLVNLDSYDKVITITKDTLNKANIRFPHISNILIPNGVNSKVFKPLGLKKANICITHTRLSKILKLTANPELYFEVVSRVCNEVEGMKFVLIGPDYDIYKDKFDALIEKFSLKDKLVLVSPLYYDMLAEYINIAKVWFYPMREDNFPLSVIEAMMCGATIVTSNLVGISEMITHNKHGLLSPCDDVDKFVSNIKKCLSNVALSKRLGEEASKKAADKYSLEKMLSEFNNVYKEVSRV